MFVCVCACVYSWGLIVVSRARWRACPPQSTHCHTNLTSTAAHAAVACALRQVLPRSWGSDDAAALCDERPPPVPAPTVASSSSGGAAPARSRKGSEAMVKCAVEVSTPAGNVPSRLVMSHAQVRALSRPYLDPI